MFNFYIGIIILSFALSYISGKIIPFFIGQNPIEPFILLGMFYLFKSSKNIEVVFRNSLKSRLFQFIFLYSFLMFCFGIMSTGAIYEVYADFRSNILFFFFLIFLTSSKWKQNEQIRFIISLAWGLTIFDCTAMVIGPYLVTKHTDSVSKYNVSTVLPVFLFIYYFYHGKTKFLPILFAIIVYEVAFAFMRSVYFVAIIGIVLIFITALHNLFRKKAKKLMTLGFLAVFFLASYYLSGIIYNYWESDGSRSVHSIRKSQEVVADATTESERLNSLTLPFTDMDKLIIPKGLGARASIETVANMFENKILSSNDSAFFYLSYHYGVLFCFTFTFFYLIRTYFIVCGFLLKNDIYIFLISTGFYITVVAIYFSQSILLSFIPAASAYAIIFTITTNPKLFFINKI